MTEYGTWVSYSDGGALVLAIVLLAIGILLWYLGTRLKEPLGVKKPGRTVSVFLILIWVLALAAFFIAYLTYAVQLYQEKMIQTPPTNPISPVTDLCALASFITIVYLTRSSGLKTALVSAFVGTAAAPMIFELPFDLIVMGRTYPPIPPAPTLFRLLFFLPLFLVEISTISFLTFSPLTKLSKYTMFSLAAVFFIFALWAMFGFSYPSEPIPYMFNVLSKIVSFVTAITLYARIGQERL